MKRDYRHDYWIESIQNILEDAGLPLIPVDKELEIAEAIIGSVECQSMAFGYVDTRRESYEDIRLKERINQLEKEVEEWKNAFRSNVSQRRGWNKNSISIGLDGSASLID